MCLFGLRGVWALAVEAGLVQGFRGWGFRVQGLGLRVLGSTPSRNAPNPKPPNCKTSSSKERSPDASSGSKPYEVKEGIAYFTNTRPKLD